MAVGFNTRTKAAAYVAAVNLAIGSSPIVTEYADYLQISFTAAQQKQLQAFIESQLKKGPSDVRIDVASVLLPPMLKFAVPAAAAILTGMFFLGRSNLLRGK